MEDNNIPKYEDTVPLYEETKPITEAQQSSTPEESSATEAFLRGAAHGASMGFDERAEAGAKSLFADQSYEQLLKDIRDRNRKVEAEHPYASLGGKLAGGVGGVLLGGAALRGGTALAKGAGLLTEGAEAAGALGTAGEALAPAAEAVSAGSNIIKNIKMGTAVGGITGAGETEDLTKLQALEDIGEGALGGGITGGVLTGAGEGIKKVAGTISKLPVVREIIQGAKRQYAGKTWDPGVVQKEISETVGGKFLPKIRALEENLSNKYDQVLDNTNIVISPTNIENASTEVKGLLSGLMKNGSETTVPARAIDNLKKGVQDSMTGLDPSTPAGRQQFAKLSDVKDGLEDFLAKNDVNLGELNRQFSDISTLRARLGDMTPNLRPVRPVGMEPEPGMKYARNQSEKADYLNTLDKLTREFINLGEGKPTQEVKLSEAAKMLGVLEKELPSEGMEPSQKIFNELAKKAEELDLVKTGAKKAEFGTGVSHTGLSLKTAPVWVGRGIGEVGKIIPKSLVNGLGNLVNQQSPEAAQHIKALTNSANPDAQKAGKMLTNVIGNPSEQSRKALMFTLEQQPWFREVVGDHLESEGDNGQ